MRCDDCQDRLLDLEYGLLDPAEVVALEAHVASCQICTSAVAAAREQKGLLAQAAKSSFPTIRFVAPVEGVTVRRPLMPRAQMVRWAVAAGILLALAGTVGPTIYASIRSAADRHSTQAAVAGLRRIREVWTTEKNALAERTAASRGQLESAMRAHDSVVEEWVKAEATALDARSMAVEVTGPASAVAGAPNDYRIRVVDPAGKAVAANVRIAVTDSAGKVRAEESYERAVVAAGATFRLPAQAWNDLPAGSGLTLAVSATDGTGRTSQLAEPINLLPPVYTTFLDTDRPTYQPGETILFRSVTLDRNRFLPPDRDLSLRFILQDAKGVAVPGMSLSGASTPVVLDARNQPMPVLGPDGRPVRGVGTGTFPLSDQLVPGDYTLAVYELPAGWAKAELPAGSVPLARRSVIVRKHAPARVNLEFAATNYGPGDTVVARLTAGQAFANVQILPAVIANGKRVTPIQAPGTLDADGKATISFALPNEPSLAQAELKVTILHGQPEEIVREVPLAMKTVGVEFFPEGGDLVAGVESRVYFRARTPDGKPVEFRGELFDGEKVLSPVTTVYEADQPATHRGLGLFTLTPETGKKYTLRGPSGEFALPASKLDGVSLTITSGVIGADQPIDAQLATAKGKKNLVIGAYTRGRPVATARVTVEAGKPVTAKLQPEPGSPGGVTRVTVFEAADEDGPGRKTLTPLAERLMFRRPVEALVLSYQVVSESIASGAPVTLNVSAKTETGKETAAILWAAVVSETIFGRNEDRTARGLPAHFFICGEVEKPDELEFADFLVSDHSKAAASLDLLLGTQGWRRFAEQAPELFHRNAPAGEADRLMVAVGSRGPVPAEFRPLVRAAAEKYQPQYLRALESLETAERNTKLDSRAVDAALTQYSYDLFNLSQTASSRRTGADWGLMQIPAAVALLVVAGLLAVVRYRLFRRGDAERRYLSMGALATLALAGFLFASAAAFESKSASNQLVEEFRLAQSLGVPFSRMAAVSAVPAPAARGPGASAEPTRIQLLEKVGSAPGVMQKSPPASSPLPGSGSPLESAAQGRPTVRAIVNRVPRDSSLASEYVQQVGRRLAAISPPGPAGERVKAAAVIPPLVVREYVHAGADPSQPNHFDATDTVLWKPVLIVPGSGTVELTFGLSGTSGYRILIAGHTLDGRVGTVSGKLQATSAK